MGNAIAYQRITVFHRTVYCIDKCRFMTRWINVQHKSRQNRSYIIWTEDCFVKHLAHPTITLFDGTLINAFYVTAHISEILLKVALNTINITIPIIIFAYPAELWKIHLKFKKKTKTTTSNNNNNKNNTHKKNKEQNKNKTKTKQNKKHTKQSYYFPGFPLLYNVLVYFVFNLNVLVLLECFFRSTIVWFSKFTSLNKSFYFLI